MCSLFSPELKTHDCSRFSGNSRVYGPTHTAQEYLNTLEQVTTWTRERAFGIYSSQQLNVSVNSFLEASFSNQGIPTRLWQVHKQKSVLPLTDQIQNEISA